MKKITKLMLTILAVMAAACFGFTAFASDGEIGVYVNSRALEFDVPPTIIEGRTMVPVRAIFEALGAEVNREQATKTVTATRDELTIKLTIGDKAIYVGGEKKELDVPALIIDGRTLVPARAVSEAFGADVQWNAGYREVCITEFSEAYKELVSLIKTNGKKYDLAGEVYEIEYIPSDKIMTESATEPGMVPEIYIMYSIVDPTPVSFIMGVNGTYIYLDPDCTGETFEIGIYTSESYFSGRNKCDVVTRDEDCMVEFDMGMEDMPEEIKPVADMISNVSAFLVHNNLLIIQEWISSTGSDLTVEELGFVNYNKRIKPLAEGKDDKCDFCDKQAETIPASLTSLFALVDINFDGEYCADHFDEKLLSEIDLETIIKAVNSILQLAQAESEAPIKYVLSTNENHIVMSLVMTEECAQMLEAAAKEEGFASLEEALEKSFFEGQDVAALSEKLTAFKAALAELNEYGVNISFDGIIINVCDSDGSVLASMKVDT